MYISLNPFADRLLRHWSLKPFATKGFGGLLCLYRV